MAKYRCPECLADVTMTTPGKWRKHGNPECQTSGKHVSAAIIMGGESDPKDDRPLKGRDYDECPACGRSPKLDENRAFKSHYAIEGVQELCLLTGRTKDGKDPTKEPPKPLLKAPAEKGPILSNYPDEKDQVRIECPEHCGGEPYLLLDGTIVSHMPSEWGEKVCKASGTKPNPIEPTQVQKSTEIPKPPDVPASPIATSMRDSAKSSMGAEFDALAAAFPRNAHMPQSTSPDSALPIPVAVRDTPFIQGAQAELAARTLASYSDAAITPTAMPQEPPADAAPDRHLPLPDAPETPEQAARQAKAKAILASEHSCQQTDGTHDGDCVSTIKPYTCDYCHREYVNGYHVCDMFVKPDPYVDESYEIWRPLIESVQRGKELVEFTKPDPLPAALDPVPMSLRGEQIAAQLKETFFAYSNRMERNVQTTLGPSEIGSPCDRRLAMSLLRIAPVNPGGDNWASFVGTCVHAGLAEMFQWADANTGRYAVEVSLAFPSIHVPRGTSDLLDRTLVMAMDHKCMGRFSLDKLRTKGPSETYRVQIHTYAYGQVVRGERIKHVAIIGWPREQASLKDLYVWVEEYDPQIARDALARVDRIAGDIEVKHIARATGLTLESPSAKLGVAKEFDVAEDCTYCLFLAKGDPGMTRGCNGKR